VLLIISGARAFGARISGSGIYCAMPVPGLLLVDPVDIFRARLLLLRLTRLGV